MLENHGLLNSIKPICILDADRPEPEIDCPEDRIMSIDTGVAGELVNDRPPMVNDMPVIVNNVPLALVYLPAGTV